jgi:hypothetical protein
VWSYRRREYSQYAVYFGEYTFSNYAFPATLPASYFNETDLTARLKERHR